MRQLHIKTRDQWREWLGKNHDKSTGVWLVFFKKHTGKPTLDYDAAVEEALCFGWIDSIIKKIDEERYARKMTPRKSGSCWSQLNKRRIKKLIKLGLMVEPGLTRVTEAQESGAWGISDRPVVPERVPDGLLAALAKNKKAKDFFDQLAPSYRKHFIGWIAAAKRQETKDRRIKEAVALLEQGKKLGLK